MVNTQRTTRGLNTNQVKDLDAAWHHAHRIGRPLNVLISVRPIDIDDMTPAERCAFFARFRNKLGVYARSHGFEPTWAWTREANYPDGSGEHMHVLMHVPARHRQDFDDTVIGWLPGAAEIDLTTANQRTRFDYEGKRLSAIAYISKQMTPQAWYKRGLIRQPGGPILGKRGGTTKNLSWKAIADYRASRNIGPITSPILADSLL